MKDLVIYGTIMIILLVIFIGFVAWTNHIMCLEYIETNPGKDFREVGFFNLCEVNYKGVWIGVEEFARHLPDWSD